MKDLAIIILNWNGDQDTIECINSIRDNETKLYDIFLMDNGSNIESVVQIERWLENEYQYKYEIISYESFCKYRFDNLKSNLTFIKTENNLGFAKGNNAVWKLIQDSYEFILLLNNDTIISDNAISNMLDYMTNNPTTGAVSCDIRLYSERNKLWNAGGYFTWYGDRRYYHQKKIDKKIMDKEYVISTPFITGCAMMIKKSTTMKVGIFTEKFFFGEEDFNYCKRLDLASIKVETVLSSRIYHKVGTSISKSQKNINSYVLHFSNRIINQRDFYTPLRWNLWKRGYLVAIFLKIFTIKHSIKLSYKTVKNILYYTTKYDEINYKTFLEINSIK